MSDQRKRPRARTSEDDSGFDVWLPALVAIIAAIFMLTNAHAEDVAADAPRAIYDAARFDADAIAREADAAAMDAKAAPTNSRHLMMGSVVVAALPDLSAVTPAEVASSDAPVIRPAVDRSVVIGAPADTGAASIGRLIAATVIAGLLLLALVGLGRTWRRVAPLAV